ncbi:PREDICTED: uncharacterized protein LOC105361016 [Ceratosolen solmsi marchali]|uniref:Uncharacterized protein LOC105361016 n=1 Tax=Ceratosolen solmsi marchali TaxID=326594 RepID=A0AAJ6YE47_9HYME|nr:PREDICTED: uncharacterized protein LOC105361016 [Ceratosolen solmsi marchali]
MHSETNTPVKEMPNLDVSLTLKQQSSFLEEDLALSSSTHDSITEKIIMEVEEKTRDETMHQSITVSESEQPQAPVIYVSEDAMDCNYDESSNISKHFELQDAPSPELFDSDADDEAESTNTTINFQNVLDEPRVSLPSPKKLTTAEQILKADKYLLKRVNKFLSGVPPPPNHTISQKDCDDFLVYIKQNRQYFWADPFKLESKHLSTESKTISISSIQKVNEENDRNEDTNSCCTKVYQQAKAGLRNLSTAFDACEQPNYLKFDHNDSLASGTEFSETTNSFTLSETLFNNCSILSTSTFTSFNEDSKIHDNDTEAPPTLFTSIKVEDVTVLPWPDAYKHKCHEIYYNRNKVIEDFENLRLKLCDRYIGAETQSTCNIWFAKQMPGSTRKRNLLAKRNNGQSPGKRLSYLARRRRTFSSANLQGLGLAEKKHLILNVRKGFIRKGKSPRGKSPRTKTPRSSAKKRHLRRLVLEGPSPRKTKIETSKRALFQSPPLDKPCSSQTVATTNVNNNNPQKIKRALFPTPKKNEAGDISQTQSLSFPESRKRKNDDELENPRQKWAKSLSFDCARNLDNSSSNTWNPARHSTSGVLSKDGTLYYGKCELSETHRKKLLWAVAEALRSKGIGMNHSLFKQYATSLARTVRKFMPDLENKNLPRKPGSTSDRMLKLAKRHVLLIVETKTDL